jgi:hypothetical protein
MREMGAGRGLHGAKMLEPPDPADRTFIEICDSLSILDMESVDGGA